MYLEYGDIEVHVILFRCFVVIINYKFRIKLTFCVVNFFSLLEM